MKNLYSSETEDIVDAIDRLTESFNEKADELIAILRDKDVKHHPMYKKEASNHTGEELAQEMFKECDCFCENDDYDPNDRHQNMM